MLSLNIFKNINKKSILYSVSTLNITTNFVMNNENIVKHVYSFSIKGKKKTIEELYGFKTNKPENNNNKIYNFVINNIENNNNKINNFVINKTENNLEKILNYCNSDHFDPLKINYDDYLKDIQFISKKTPRSYIPPENKINFADEKRKICWNFAKYILKILNNEIKKVNEETDIFSDFENPNNEKIEDFIGFVKFRSLKHITNKDIYKLLNCKLGFYCITTENKKKYIDDDNNENYNTKLVKRCIACRNRCKNICNIFCTTGSDIYKEFLESDEYKKSLSILEKRKGKEYKDHYEKVSKNLIDTVNNPNFIKHDNSGIINENIDESLKNFFINGEKYLEDPLKYNDDFLEYEIPLDEDRKIDFKSLSEKKISDYNDILKNNSKNK